MLMNFEKLATAFDAYGIDISGKDDVADTFWARQVDAIRRLSEVSKSALIDQIRATHREDYASFIAELEARIVRTVREVVMYPLHGRAQSVDSIKQAIEAVRDYRPDRTTLAFLRFEFMICYTNGDQIQGSYASEAAAIAFLTKLL